MTEATAHVNEWPQPELVAVPRLAVEDYWPLALEMLKPAIARNGLYTHDAVLSALVSGEMQLWLVETGEQFTLAIVTEIANYPARSVCAVVFLGGREFDRALPLLSHIEAWSREVGCDRFVNSGRPGFAKKLKKRGYRVESVSLVKDFHDA